MPGINTIMGVPRYLKKLLLGTPESTATVTKAVNVAPKDTLAWASLRTDDDIIKYLQKEHGMAPENITPELIAKLKSSSAMTHGVPVEMTVNDIIPGTKGLIGQNGAFDSAILSANAKAKANAVKAAMSPENIKAKAEALKAQAVELPGKAKAAMVELPGKAKTTLVGTPEYKDADGRIITKYATGFLGRGGELSGGAKALGGATGLAALAKVASGNEEDYVDPLKQPYMGVATQDATGQDIPVQEVPAEAQANLGILDRIEGLPAAVKYGVPLGALAVGTGAVGLRRILNKNRG